MTTRATERAKRESNPPRFSRLSRGFAARRLCARALPLPPWKGKSFTSSTPPFFYFFLSFQLSFINSSKNACYAHLSGHSNNSSIKLPDLYCKRRLCCVVSNVYFLLKIYVFTLFMSWFQFSILYTFTISSKNGEKIPSGPCPVA